MHPEHPLRQRQAADRLPLLIEGLLRGLENRSEPSRPARTSPAAGLAEAELSAAERNQVAGLMRINHTGEVCAQALYLGQAAVAHRPETRSHLLAAAAEERDHLDWCFERLGELEARPSVLNPLWYAGSFLLGAGAALFSDRLSLGFVVETERQVEAHLGEHMDLLPQSDQKSRAIVSEMQAEEANHGAAARAAGGIELPKPLPRLMALAAGLMKAIAYRI